MGAPKLKEFKKKKGPTSTENKVPELSPEELKLEKAQVKNTIEQLKKKLKKPENAKKAALIIEQMLKEKSKQKK